MPELCTLFNEYCCIILEKVFPKFVWPSLQIVSICTRNASTREDTEMMLSTVNTATNNGNFTNNTVTFHNEEENAHITEWQLKPIETPKMIIPAHPTQEIQKHLQKTANLSRTQQTSQALLE